MCKRKERVRPHKRIDIVRQYEKQLKFPQDGHYSFLFLNKDKSPGKKS